MYGFAKETTDIFGIFWSLLVLVNHLCKTYESKHRVPALICQNFLILGLTFMAAEMARHAKSVRLFWNSDRIAPVVSEIIKIFFFQKPVIENSINCNWGWFLTKRITWEFFYQAQRCVNNLTVCKIIFLLWEAQEQLHFWGLWLWWILLGCVLLCQVLGSPWKFSRFVEVVCHYWIILLIFLIVLNLIFLRRQQHFLTLPWCSYAFSYIF